MGLTKRSLEEQQERGWASREGFVCCECVLDYALKAVIEANLVEETCGFCGRTGDALIAAGVDVVIDAVAQGIRSEYEDPANHVSYVTAEGGYQLPLISIDDLLWDNEISENSRLIDVIASAMELPDWVEIYPYGPNATEALVWGWQYFREYVMHIRRFTFLIPSGTDERLLDPGTVPPEQMLAAVSQAIDDGQLTKLVPAGTSFWRARPHEPHEHPKLAKDLGSAPSAVAQTNRMTASGISAFYGASTKEVALAEVGGYASPGQIFTVCRFTTTAPLTVIDLVNLPPVPSLFDPENRYRRPALEFLRAFSADAAQIAKPEDKQHLEYVPTQIVSEYLRHSHLTGPVHGIQWRSTKDSAEVSSVLFLDNDACVDILPTPPATAGPQLVLDANSVEHTA